VIQKGNDVVTNVAVIAATFAVFLGIMSLIVRAKRRTHDRRVEIWRKFALENRLQLTAEPATWFKLGEARIRGRVGLLDLEIETYRVRVGKSHQVWVRVRARGPGPAGTFEIRAKDLLARAKALLGGGGVAIDRGPFDERFAVRSSPESLAPDVLGPELRSHFAALTRSPRAEYADGTCELAWYAGEDSLAQLSDAVEFHARLFGAFQRGSRAVT
jgi:hypothetical protein